MQQGIALFLEGMGQQHSGDDLEKTPERVAKAWVEDLVAGYAVDPVALVSWTPTPEDSGAVLVRRLSFASVCAHHLLPFFGHAHVAYLPGRRQAGLSKVGRVVDGYARRLQTQEQLTQQVVDALVEALEPRGVLAVLEAEHTCMTLRGVRKEQGRMITVASAGIYREDAAARNEMMQLLRGHGAA